MARRLQWDTPSLFPGLCCSLHHPAPLLNHPGTLPRPPLPLPHLIPLLLPQATSHTPSPSTPSRPPNHVTPSVHSTPSSDPKSLSPSPSPAHPHCPPLWIPSPIHHAYARWPLCSTHAFQNGIWQEAKNPRIVQRIGPSSRCLFTDIWPHSSKHSAPRLTSEFASHF